VGRVLILVAPPAYRMFGMRDRPWAMVPRSWQTRGVMKNQQVIIG
jgi:hypothetical protein